MISPGDHVAVGVSGGKDSLVLLEGLARYRSFAPNPFTLTAVTVTMGLEPFDLSGVSRMCERLEVPYVILKTEIGKIIFEERQEKNPCSLCAKMRRGALIAACEQFKCNKLALGHHRDDALETLLLSILHEGRMHTFHPASTLEKSGIMQIRPLCCVAEKDVAALARRLELPVVKSPCPANGKTERAEMKALLNDLSKRYPDARDKLLAALMNQDQYGLWNR